MMAGGLALFGASTILTGCGASGGGSGSSTTTHAAGSTSTQAGATTTQPSGGGSSSTTHAVVSTTTAAPAATTTQNSDPRTPLYVALRMDDISVGEDEQIQANIINWFSENKIPFNFHIITYSEDGPWPSKCKEDPSSSQFCSSPIVQKLQEVYDAGQIVGTSDDAWLDLGCHSHQHDYWPRYIAGENTGAGWQHNDLAIAMGILNEAYPDASIRSFAAPANAANNATVQAALAQGLDIVTTQATVICDASSEPGTAPGWNYGVGPCGNTDNVTYTHDHWDCIPPNDRYYTTEGAQKANGVYSLPCSSANSNFKTVEIGLSVEETIGVGTCGCVNEVCTMIANAKEMAAKSNGLHWTTLIMHPQTTFDSTGPNQQPQTWPEWLDQFLIQVRALEEYNVIFKTMHQMTELRAPTPSSIHELIA
jgi:hypothetical protein